LKKHGASILSDDPQERSTMFLQNAGICLQDYTVPQSIREKCNITFPSVDVLKLKIYAVLADCKGF
jgi:hypothetical protein